MFSGKPGGPVHRAILEACLPCLGALIVAFVAVAVVLRASGARLNLRKLRRLHACQQGGVQSLSRALYAGIIPSDKTAEFFGFYNMLGKFAAVLGPFLVAGVALFTENSRYAILAVAPLFLFGAAVLYLVDTDKGHREANALEGET